MRSRSYWTAIIRYYARRIRNAATDLLHKLRRKHQETQLWEIHYYEAAEGDGAPFTLWMEEHEGENLGGDCLHDSGCTVFFKAVAKGEPCFAHREGWELCIHRCRQCQMRACWEYWENQTEHSGFHQLGWYSEVELRVRPEPLCTNPASTIVSEYEPYGEAYARPAPQAGQKVVIPPSWCVQARLQRNTERSLARRHRKGVARAKRRARRIATLRSREYTSPTSN